MSDIFSEYAPFIQDFIYKNNWESLRAVQVAAGDVIFHSDDNLLLCAICVGLLVWAVGMGMGGITGFAMNQARDLGPRMAYQVLPIKDKADNNWRYGLTVPGIAPFVGAALAALFVHGFLGIF